MKKMMKAAALAGLGALSFAGAGAFAADVPAANTLTVKGMVVASPCYITRAAASEPDRLSVSSIAQQGQWDTPFGAELRLPSMTAGAARGSAVNLTLYFSSDSGGAECSNGTNGVRIYPFNRGGFYTQSPSVAMNELDAGARVASNVGVEVLNADGTPYGLDANALVPIGSASSASNSQSWGFRLSKPTGSTATNSIGNVQVTFEIAIEQS